MSIPLLAQARAGTVAMGPIGRAQAPGAAPTACGRREYNSRQISDLCIGLVGEIGGQRAGARNAAREPKRLSSAADWWWLTT